jgi:hypothetical protein
MKTTMLPEHPDAKSPAGADIRYIMDGETGNMIHSTVPAHQVNKATVHATVNEFWYVLAGYGEIWRDREYGCQRFNASEWVSQIIHFMKQSHVSRAAITRRNTPPLIPMHPAQ